MNSLRKSGLILFVAAMIVTALVAPAAAESPTPGGAALACSNGACQLAGDVSRPLGLLQAGANVVLAQVPFRTTADGGTQATVDAQKDLTLALPVGNLTLTNARLQVEVGRDGKITRLNGSADMPFPTFGLIDSLAVITPARASVGLDLGKNLPDVGVALQPDRPYLFFNANSFLAAAAKTTASADQFALEFTPGQRLTLVVDTVEPVAYLNGQVTLSLTDQVALLGGALESTPLGPYIPNTIPLRERTQFGLSGEFNKDVAQSRLTLRGGYMLDPGLLPQQLGVEAQLVNLMGQLTLSRDGVLVDGVLKSSIAPDKVFDGNVHVQTFIAFDEAAGGSRASVDASAALPFAKLGAKAGVEAGRGAYEASGQLATPLNPTTASGKIQGKLPDVATAVGIAARHVGSTAGQVAGAVGAGAGKAGQAIGSAASKAAGTVGSYARFGLQTAGSAVNAGKDRLTGQAGAGASASAEPAM